MFLVAVSRGQNYKADGFSLIEIADSASGRVYARKPIENGGDFTIEFIHSVNNSAVHETFRVDGREIQPVSVRFYSFGAGMPAELEEGQQMIRDGDTIIVTGFNRNFTELNYIVGTVSDHLLIINGERISLRNLCGRNAHVTLKVK